MASFDERERLRQATKADMLRHAAQLTAYAREGNADAGNEKREAEFITTLSMLAGSTYFTLRAEQDPFFWLDLPTSQSLCDTFVLCSATLFHIMSRDPLDALDGNQISNQALRTFDNVRCSCQALLAHMRKIKRYLPT